MHQLHHQSSLLSSLPHKDSWIENGMVERRTVHANVVWRARQMVLTKDCIYIASTDSDLVVDKISIREISSIGIVDQNTSTAFGEDKGVQTGPKSSKSRRISVLTNLSRSDNFESFNDISRETYPFEIKTFVGDFERCYFVRVGSSQERDTWIAAIKTCLKSTLRKFAVQHSWLEQQQRRARALQSKYSFRCVIAFLILADFLSCVFKSEFLPDPDGPTYQFFVVLDVVLFGFFSLELLLNMFGNWRNYAGRPFVGKPSSWFQIATVLLQGLAFVDPEIASLKVIRVMRIFDVGSAFKSLASCQMILKAIRQGASRGSNSAINPAAPF